MDTGIGKSSYSVMEQGKMDLILSTRPEDRRYIFEEAAGISKYKYQKKESLKKLTETSDNLDRINDIIKEIEREKDFKSKQAETTKVYLSLRNELSDLDIKINCIRYRDLEKKENKLLDDINRHNMEREKISARVSTTSADNEVDEKRKNDLQHQLFELEKRLHAHKIRARTSTPRPRRTGADNRRAGPDGRRGEDPERTKTRAAREKRSRAVRRRHRAQDRR